jgi:hypothetical protein
MEEKKIERKNVVIYVCNATMYLTSGGVTKYFNLQPPAHGLQTKAINMLPNCRVLP